MVAIVFPGVILVSLLEKKLSPFLSKLTENQFIF